MTSMPEQYGEIKEMLNVLNKLPKPIVTENMKEQLQIGFVQRGNIDVIGWSTTCT